MGLIEQVLGLSDIFQRLAQQLAHDSPMLSLRQVIAGTLEQIGLRRLTKEQNGFVEFGFDQQQFTCDIQQHRIVGICGQIAKTIRLVLNLLAQPVQTQHGEAFCHRMQRSDLGGNARSVTVAPEQEFIERVLGPIQLASGGIGQGREEFTVAAGKNAACALQLRRIAGLFGPDQRSDPIDFRRPGFGQHEVFQQRIGHFVNRMTVGRNDRVLLPVMQQFVERGKVRLQPRTRANTASGKAGKYRLGEHAKTRHRGQFRSLQLLRKFAQAGDLEWIAQPIAQRPLVSAPQRFGFEFAAVLDAQDIKRCNAVGRDTSRKPDCSAHASDEWLQRGRGVGRAGFETLEIIGQHRDRFEQHRSNFGIWLLNRIQRQAQLGGQHRSASDSQRLQRSGKLPSARSRPIKIGCVG